MHIDEIHLYYSIIINNNVNSCITFLCVAVVYLLTYR